MPGKIEGKRSRGQQKVRHLASITDTLDVNLSKLWEMVEDREAWHAAVRGVTKSKTRLSKTATWKNNDRFIRVVYTGHFTSVRGLVKDIREVVISGGHRYYREEPEETRGQRHGWRHEREGQLRRNREPGGVMCRTTVPLLEPGLHGVKWRESRWAS